MTIIIGKNIQRIFSTHLFLEPTNKDFMFYSSYDLSVTEKNSLYIATW